MMRASQRGFTAIEMMVTVAVIAVMLALVAPSFQEQLARRKLEGAATELSTDIQYVRTQAVSENAAVSLTTTASGYTIGGANPKAVTLDPSLTLTPAVTITYNPLRGLGNAAQIDMGSSRTSATLRVSTNPVGSVRLCSPLGSLKGYTPC